MAKLKAHGKIRHTEGMRAEYEIGYRAAKNTCVDCGKEGLKMPFTCPACKTVRCFKCWETHLNAKICAYGKTTVVNVL